MDQERADAAAGRPSLPAWTATLPTAVATAVTATDPSLPSLYLPVPALPDRLRTLRARVASWAQATGTHDVRRDDMVLAVNEAATNSIEHAYRSSRGVLTVFAGCDPVDGVARIVIADRGDWREPPADPGFRGRGLSIIRELSPVFELYHDNHGTTVSLGWPYAP